MELVCEKYREKMPAANAHCQHPDEYCKFRTSCMIYFMARENQKEQARSREEKQEKRDE